MRGSAFVKPCEIEVRLWYDKLLRVSKLFDEWANVQISWLSLLPLFSTEDIRDQMPKETALFDEVDRNLCNNIKVCMSRAYKIMYLKLRQDETSVFFFFFSDDHRETDYNGNSGQ